MTAASQLVDLLVRYEESKERGQPYTPEELCRHCPELLDDVRRALRAVEKLPALSTAHVEEDASTKRVTVSVASRDGGRSAGDSSRFTIVRPHARGGLGEVLIAQDMELGRQVAYKRIQAPRADDAHARHRFLREAEITARLEHPGIVPIYGLVTDEAGQPSYAMRFIQGETLGDAIKRFHEGPLSWNSLVFRQLLQRFISVCQTMGYAHSRGIIHRDLKPANVMLGEYGETLVVDWGLAKAYQQASNDSQVQSLPYPEENVDDITQEGSAIGTPSYMSPEQAAGDWARVGPSSDIYSLGATLYELLTGKRVLQGESVFEILDKVRHGLIPQPRKVLPSIPRPLEAICLKAMSLQISDRYGSATALGVDLDHWLADEPVTSYQETRLARLGRWARKHPMQIGIFTAGTLTTAVALGLGLVIVGQLNSQLDTTNRDLTDKKQTLDLTNTKLQKTNKVFESVSDILADVSREIDPRVGQHEGESLKVLMGKRLEKAAATLESEDTGDPVAVARLQVRLGVSLIHLGHYPRAINLLTKSHQTLSSALGSDHTETLDAANQLVSVLRAAGRLDEALPLAEETLKLRKAKLGSDNPDTANSIHNLAFVYRDKGWIDRALPLFEESFRLLKSKLGVDHQQTLIAMNSLAVIYMALDRHVEALPLTENLFKLMKAKLGSEHTDTIGVMNTLAGVYLTNGRSVDAISLVEKSYQSLKVKLGPVHPDTLITLNNLAFLYKSVGNYDASLPLMTEALKLFEAKLGPQHINTLGAASNLGDLYYLMNRNNDAIDLLEKTLKSLSSVAGDNHPSTVVCLGNLGNAYRNAGRIKDALPLLEKSLKLLKSLLGVEHAETLNAMNDLAVAYGADGRHRDSANLHKETLKLRQARLGPNHRFTLMSMSNQAFALRDAGQLNEALQLGEATLKLRQKNLGPEDIDTLFSKYFVGNMYFRTGRQADGIALLQDALQSYEKKLGSSSHGTLHCKQDLGIAYLLINEPQKAMPLFLDVLPRRKTLLGENHPDTITTAASLAMSYFYTGNFDKAEPMLRDIIARQRTQKIYNQSGTADLLSVFGMTLLNRKKHTEAETVARECLAIREKLMPDSWTTFNARSLLGGALAGQKRYSDAEPLLLAGYHGMIEREKQIQPLGKGRIGDALERLTQLYEAWGKADQALVWRKKWEAWKTEKPKIDSINAK